jgi:hypothetical protein
VKKLIVGLSAGIVVAVAAVAFANSQNVRPLGGTIDTVTFADGTVASSAYVSGLSTSSIVVIQVKQTDGKTCYGIATQNSASGTSMSCLP